MLFMTEDAHESRTNAAATGGLTVLIADDHHLIRAGLKHCLQGVGQDVAVLEAETLEAAVTTFRAHPEVDLVLLDMSMLSSCGSPALDAFARACPSAKIVMVSSVCDIKTVQEAFGKGIRGFIPKLAGRATFINALRFVLDGGTYIPPEALASQAVRAPDASPQTDSGRADALRCAKLTARQIDVLAQLLDGKPNKQICRELNLALGTVKCHVGAILGALEVNSRAEAIAAAEKRGLRQWLPQSRMGRHQHA
jgi:DNA-binding NarL/FixJ family response regulator